MQFSHFQFRPKHTDYGKTGHTWFSLCHRHICVYVYCAISSPPSIKNWLLRQTVSLEQIRISGKRYEHGTLPTTWSASRGHQGSEDILQVIQQGIIISNHLRCRWKIRHLPFDLRERSRPSVTSRNVGTTNLAYTYAISQA